jgi:hypothetical protein
LLIHIAVPLAVEVPALRAKRIALELYAFGTAGVASKIAPFECANSTPFAAKDSGKLIIGYAA